MRKSAMEINRETRDLFLRMVGDFALDRKSVYPDCSGELEDLLYLAHIHSLEPVVYYMLREQRKQLLEQKPELFRHMQRAYHSAVYVSVTQEASRAEIEEAFQNAGIQLVFFKGAQLRQLYPVPELRTMGDMDCLIRREDRAKAHQLMIQLGYECQVDAEPVWMYNRNGIVIEMHTRVAADSLGNEVDYPTMFSDAMMHVHEENGYLCLEWEYHFCYLIYHIAKHLSSTGAGVRMIADIAAFMYRRANQMEWERVKSVLQEFQLWKTTLAVFGLCRRWFSVEVPADDTVSQQTLDDLEAYIIAGGTFGFETHDAGDMYRRRAIQNKGELNGWKFQIHMMFRYLFPSSDVLIRYFLPAKRHRWLVPVAWVCRCWGGIFERKQRSLATIRSMTQGDIQRSRREAELLREIGL
ncbi:nucleotidyltransferase family protein [Pseudoflavonifractor capillosus]|uniref:nucleotidyltransferase domain-containing protein n=1 Tax=Pseudoflavonifractor capillosus TaxID=106588 RepID=UPI00195DB5F2|nr:nucleotidyltransferase family protein [Pseudoflavonifractor capillosus]MBM6694472.1 nucleotidyltransferase family protein [Pseudoflavonifractor capillosus]